jgi:hypothetical protein
MWITLCIRVRPGHETLTHYFSSSGRLGAASKKSAPGHVTSNYFFHLAGNVCNVVHSGPFEMSNVDALFFMLGGPGAVSIKSASGHVTVNLCFCFLSDL